MSSKETIINIYVIIENGKVTSFKAHPYFADGTDREKIEFLQSKVKEDYPLSQEFPAPVSPSGNFMSYDKFSKLEERGMQKELYGRIFDEFDLPDNPLILVTPVVDGKIIENKLF
ncbi:MAG: hypothetical protein D6830_04855 [Ignavibacteria bacterium]|nr:MAG: hypothetical protein D6830_04855 [Ignavibacteria bacterium]